MSDGREEREEEKARIEQQKQGESRRPGSTPKRQSIGSRSGSIRSRVLNE